MINPQEKPVLTPGFHRRGAYRLAYADRRSPRGKNEPGIRDQIIAAVEKSILKKGIAESLKDKDIFFDQNSSVFYLLKIPKQSKPDILNSVGFHHAFGFRNSFAINLNELSSDFQRALLEVISRSEVEPEESTIVRKDVD